MSVLGELSEIYIYPIKSLPGIKIDKAIVTKTGIVHPENKNVADRRWMIIDENGAFKTLRQIPKLALINVTIQGDFFIFEAAGMKQLKVPICPKNSNRINCRIRELRIHGYSYGGEVADWLTAFVNESELKLDLVAFGSVEGENDHLRSIKDINQPGCEPRDEDCVVYSDASPFMLVSEASLCDLNSHLQISEGGDENKKKQHKVFTMRNFRPNFVVKGCEAFAEDEWRSISIGETKFIYINKCSRCILTTVDPDKGIKDADQEPLTTLRKYRLKKEIYQNSPLFGVYFVCENEGQQLQVGDLIINSV